MARVCVDSTYFEVLPDGNLTIIPGALGFQAVETFLVPGSFNFTKAVYPGAKWLYVECVGGGGGGAGASAIGAGLGACRGGGGGGGYSASWIDADTIAGVVTVIVGAGGLAGASGNGDGGLGNPSSFGALVLANGGFGSQASMVAGTTGADPGGFGSNAGTGQVAKRGDSGDPGIMVTATVKASGKGGMSGWNGSGGPAVTGSGPGLTGQDTYGGGGSGAAASNTANPGGAGSGGQVRVTIYR